jgi:hypothetical protein
MKRGNMNIKRTYLGLVLCVTMVAAGCSTAWLSTFDGYLKIAGPILIQILEIVSVAKGLPVNPALVAKINADQKAVNTLADSVNKAAAADLPNTCSAFNQAVQTFAGDLTQIEQLANIGPSTAGEIGAAVGIAQAAIQEIEAPIAACSTAPSPAAARQILKAAALSVKSPNDTVKRFNAVVDKKHHVHLHSFPVRAVTFGYLQ